MATGFVEAGWFKLKPASRRYEAFDIHDATVNRVLKASEEKYERAAPDDALLSIKQASSPGNTCASSY
jgi:hypothetical protein